MPRKARTDRKTPKRVDSAKRGKSDGYRYDVAKVEAILRAIAEDGKTTKQACAEVGVARATFISWISADKGDLRKRYRQAKEIYFDSLVEDCVEIADDGTNDYVERHRKDGSTYIALNSEHVQRSALRVTTRLRVAEFNKTRIASANYGEDDDADEDAAMLAAVAALERIAAQKVSSAQ